MEYTDQQRATFKDGYAKRLRKKLIAIALVFAMMAPLPFTEDGDVFFGVSVNLAGPVFLALLFVGWVIFESRNWRCPACNMYLGRNFNPRHCRWCGVELRGKSPAA